MKPTTMSCEERMAMIVLMVQNLGESVEKYVAAEKESPGLMWGDRFGDGREGIQRKIVCLREELNKLAIDIRIDYE